MRRFEQQMLAAAGEPVATDNRVYHMVPTSVYDRVMQEGLKPMVGNATNRFHPEAKPFIHAMSDPSYLGLYTPWVYEQHGPFHVVSAPAHYFKTVHPSSDPIVPADRQYEGTGAEPGTLVSDQNIPPHELRHEHSWDSPFVQQELMDQWYEDNGGRPRTAAQWLPHEDETADHMLGQCAAWAAAHQQEYPHLRFGIDHETITPEHHAYPYYAEDHGHEPEGRQWSRPQHVFTHDDKYFYDVEGAHPLSQLPQWDNYTLNHDLHDVEMTGLLEPGYMPSPEWIRTYAPAPSA